MAVAAAAVAGSRAIPNLDSNLQFRNIWEKPPLLDRCVCSQEMYQRGHCAGQHAPCTAQLLPVR